MGAQVAALTKANDRLDTVDTRTEAVETSLRHELTERRDALVAEMKQLEALIARLSRNFEGRSAAPAAQSASGADGGGLQASLQDGKVDLLLQPIVSLPQRRVAFYEGFPRHRQRNGDELYGSSLRASASAASLSCALDHVTAYRSVQIVRKLAERDRRVGVFCNISTATLQDEAFFPDFLDFMSEARDLSGALIFEIAADDFEIRSRRTRDSMDRLAALGFRFSLDESTTLGMDLPRLQDAGVRFVKIAAESFLQQAGDEAGPRPISVNRHNVAGRDVTATFARHGVTLIADRVSDEKSGAALVEYDVPFGQGGLFGAPRAMKASLTAETAPPKEFVARFSAAT